ERFHVPRVPHVGDQADEIVLVCPDIPFGPAILFGVGAEITVSELALHELRDGMVEFLAQDGVPGVDPGKTRGMKPLADVLAVPGLAARTLAVTFKKAVRIKFEEA